MAGRKLILTTVMASLINAGCSGMIEPYQQQVGGALTKAEGHLPHGGKVIETMPPQATTRSSSVWIPTRNVEDDVPAGLPSSFNVHIAANREFTSLSDVADFFTRQAGIPVLINVDAVGANQRTASAPQGAAAPAAPNVPPPVNAAATGLPPPPPLPSSSASMVGSSAFVTYSGSRFGFLDHVAPRFNVAWEYKDGRVTFYRYQTKTFRIYAIPGTTALDTRISSQSNSSGTGASGSTGATGSTSTATGSSAHVASSNATANDLNVWRGYEEAIKGMMSGNGKVTVSPATGTVTVTDVPQVIARVKSFVDNQNAAMARQVEFDVRVLTVQISDSDEYGINWNLLYNSLNRRYGVSFSNQFQTAAGAPQVQFSVLNTAPAGSRSAAFSGSDAIVSALSEQGKVARVTSWRGIGLNNQPIPVQVGDQIAYAARSSTSTVPTVGTTTSLEPGMLHTGFSMNILPHLLEGGRLLMQVAVDMSSLRRMATFSSGGSSIQTPEVETRNLLQRAAMRSGETLVLTGFEQTSTSATESGVGSPSNSWLGGGVRGTKSRNVVIILITPVISERV